MSKKPQKVAVLLGGRSSEREVSIRTGQQISRALAEQGYAVREIDTASRLVSQLEEFLPDVVFIALHGKCGEDGTIQGLLEILGFPYTGSGVLASALGMDKLMTKKILLTEGIETPPFQVVMRGDLQSNEISAIAGDLIQQMGLPLIVKPSCQGSTIGISKAGNQRELEEAISAAVRYDSTVLIEKFIEGVEVTAAVLGTEDLRVLPLIEIISETGFYDYTAKYSKGLSHHIIPARILPEVAQKVESLALKTFQSLQCRQFARVDFMINREGIPYVLEVNTIPGMTELSLFPDAAKAAGISFSELVSRLVDEAWKLASEEGK